MEMETTAIERYAIQAKNAGLPVEQVRNFMSSGYVALPNFLPFHAAARQCNERGFGVDRILLDGTRGSAKSHAVIAQIGLDDCQRFPGLKWLFLRKVQRAAAESFQDLVSRVLQGVPHKANSEKVTFSNESKILIGGYNDDNDIARYIGIEYDGVAVEEATQLSGDKLNKLFGSMRTSRQDWIPRSYLTTNAGGIGHSNIKKMFIDPARENRETNTRRFFSSYKDNPFINIEYKQYLEGLTGTLAKIWADCDWDTFAGQAFSQWDYDRHILRGALDIPAHWTRVRGIDWGYASPFSCLWGAIDPDTNRVILYREVYGVGFTDRQQAERIKMATPPTENIAITFADPSMWTKRTITDIATSAADIYAQHGVYLTPGDNGRINGKRKIDRLLANLPDGKPGLMVHESCANFIRTFPELIYDDKNPEDVDTSQEDHAYDALRYLLTSIRDFTKKQDKKRTHPLQEAFRR